MESTLTAEVSPSAVAANLNLLRGRTAAGTKVCAVVKSDCYGHGLEILLDAVAGGAEMLGVATPAEAFQLRSLGYAGEILMLYPACVHADAERLGPILEELIADRVTLTMVALPEVAAAARAAERVGANVQVHVNIDTGMTRCGVLPDAAGQLIGEIRRAKGVQLAGLYTHFATADEADKSFARQQLRRFLDTVESCGGRQGLLLHAANSAATIDLPETHLDMIRPGISLFGYQPSDQMENRLPLRPALRLWTRLVQVKDVPAGARVGYGLTHVLGRPGRVGLIPAGYADGYLRSLSNRATMRVRGRDVPVCGRVSMNLIVLDLTDLPVGAVGDEVEMISADPAAAHSAENLARLAGTIPHEVTCRLGPRVRRVRVD